MTQRSFLPPQTHARLPWKGLTLPVLAAIGIISLPTTAPGQTIFSQDFEGLTLGPNVNETAVPGAAVWTKTPPTGWTIDDTGVAGINSPGVGVTEWKGWSFANRVWWATVAENQGRADFLRGTGTVAIADPDEWDDLGDPADIGTFNSFLKTPPIVVTGLRPNSLALSFDSSFRPEGSQKASVTVSFDGGAPVTVFEWVAVADTKTNERVTFNINNPAGATNMVLTWGMTNAGNNWYWAIDNIKVDRVGPLFEENFDALPLLDSVQEASFGTEVWTNIPPDGWAVDNTEMFKGFWDPDPAPEDSTQWPGMQEWKGWAFANKDWWPTVDNQRRSEFTRASGTIAIADPDEWDDAGSPVQQGGKFNSLLNTPEISLAGIPANTVLLKFDSCWRPECCDDGDFSNNQTAAIKVSFDGGAEVEVLNWSSNTADPNFKNDSSTNESILVPVPNPAGAQKMRVSFGLVNAANDWFWAIDNISLSAGAATLANVTPTRGGVVFDIADTGANKIATNTIVLKLNDVVVPTTVTPEGALIRVTHAPATPFPPASTYTYVLTAKDTAGADVSFSGSFTTPTPILPLEPLVGPSGSEGQLGVRYIWGTSAQIGGIARALQVIQGVPEPEFDGLFFDTEHTFINHYGSGANFGRFLDDLPYPDDVLSAERWTGEDFIQLAKGRIRITEAGEYTFGIHSDDGFGFRLYGAEFTASNGGGIIDVGSPDTVLHADNTGDSNTRAVATLQPGDYDLEFFWWERGTGDYGELYAAKGRFLLDTATDTWQLIGAEGGLPLVGAGSPAIHITNVVKLTNPDALRLDFTVNPGESYIAQYSLDLVGWTSTGDPITPPANATTATTTIPLTSPPFSTATQAHFRIRKQ